MTTHNLDDEDTQPLSLNPLWTPAQVRDYLLALRVIDVWKHNETGYVTNPALYHEQRGEVVGAILHATPGTNSLPYLTDGAARDGRMVCADQLIPKQPGIIYTLVPPGFYPWHAGPEHWNGLRSLNQQMWGIEIENRNDGKDPYTESQYVSVAATWAYKAAERHLFDHMLTLHRITAPTRRDDPKGWDLARFWAYVRVIRKPDVWPDYWPVKLWYHA
jgi:N-acetyl-anhydromuramyl-L-alanine amidase AmpD